MWIIRKVIAYLQPYFFYTKRFLTLIFTSCSNDDDSSSQQDPVIGTWKYYKYYANSVEIPLSECEKQKTIVFRSDNTLDFEFYEENESGTCVLVLELEGTWSNEGGNVYAMDFGEGPSNQVLTFESNTFYIEDVIEDTTYRVVYKRN
ncbi:MAG TPA: lipocalin family protein [Aquaticitalea sp.]|nr:lipocalin family protein [Aquaticitalea sp.]